MGIVFKCMSKAEAERIVRQFDGDGWYTQNSWWMNIGDFYNCIHVDTKRREVHGYCYEKYYSDRGFKIVPAQKDDLEV